MASSESSANLDTTESACGSGKPAATYAAVTRTSVLASRGDPQGLRGTGLGDHPARLAALAASIAIR